jgi:hypothetical protein
VNDKIVMGDFDADFIHTLATQSWSLYGVGMCLILLRMYVVVNLVIDLS